MREHEPMTQTINVTQARQEFGQLLNRVFRRETRVIVEKSGIPVAAIVSADDLDALQRFEQQRVKAFTVIDRMRAAFADVPDDELEREVDKAIAQVRAEKAGQGTKARAKG